MLDSGFKPGPGQPCRTEPGASAGPCALLHRGRGVFGSGLNLLVHVHAFPRARISTQAQGLCLQCVCDQHAAGSSSCPDSQAPAFGPPFLRWDGVRGRPSWQEP